MPKLPLGDGQVNVGEGRQFSDAIVEEVIGIIVVESVKGLCNSVVVGISVTDEVVIESVLVDTSFVDVGPVPDVVPLSNFNRLNARKMNFKMFCLI